jgi:DNA-binding MarR family transcriptional regulator
MILTGCAAMGRAHVGKTQEDKSIAADGDGLDGFVGAVLAASWLLVGISSRSVSDLDKRTTLTQFRTMAVLSRRRSVNLSRLATELGVNVSTAMRSIDRLIAAGYASRTENPASRREVVLCLTAEGEEFVAAVVSRRKAEIARLLAAMPEPSRDLLVSGLRTFVAAADSVGLRPAAPAVLGW